MVALEKGLDQLDARILVELRTEARLSFRELARTLRVATKTVQARIKRMENLGIIRGYHASLNYEKLGYDLTAVVEVTVAKGRLLETERDIAKIPATCAVYDTTGLTDVIVIGKFRNRRELSSFTKKLLSMPYVERTNTHVVLEVHKEDVTLPLRVEGQEAE